ncbi:MAG TPA: hypothetical protein VF223_15505 [Trebonia sp.]
MGAAFTIAWVCPVLMSWQVTAPMTGTANRSHSRRWVSACLRDHRRSADSRSGSRYQAIRSAPGRLIFGAPAASRSVTLSSLPASLSSDTASHCCRSPSSYQTARHRSPSNRAGRP